MDRKTSDVPEVLLDSLYQAAIHSEMWEGFLRQVLDVFRADTAAIIFHDPVTARTGIKVNIGFSDEMRSDLEQLLKFSPWMREIRKFQKEGWYSGTPEDVMSMDAFRESAFFNDIFRKHRIEWVGVAFVFGPNGSLHGLAVSRRDLHLPFNNNDKALLRALVPHLNRVISVHKKLSLLQERSIAGQHALDLIGGACIIMDGRRQVMTVNRRAQLILSRGDILSLKNGRLLTVNSNDQNILDACIMQACSVTDSDAVPSAITLRQKDSALYVSILPYHSGAAFLEDLEDTPAALIFITTPDEEAEGEHRLWQDMFGLSPAECRVAEMMKQGAEVTEISEVLKIRINTVRYYQKSIYRKTGVPGQGLLIKLLTRLPLSDI